MLKFGTRIVVAHMARLLFSQPHPDGSHVYQYFPHFVTGGSQEQRWESTFTFVNPSPSSPAVLELIVYRSDGSRLAMDFGSGVQNSHRVVLPPRGSRVLHSRGRIDPLTVGWAMALSSLPIHGTVAYRQLINGVPRQEIAAQPTLPTLQFSSSGNGFLGVAIANASTQPTSVRLDFYDREGTRIASSSPFTLPPFNHTSFTLAARLPGVRNSDGTLIISAVDAGKDRFIAWTVGSDSTGILSTLPSGAWSWPGAHRERIWSIYMQLYEAARLFGILDDMPVLEIPSQPLNAYAREGKIVGVTLALAELLSDSNSELAFVVGHEFGHIYQTRTGRLTFDGKPEFDADVWGMVLALIAGYDPYASAGVLAKLAMVTGRAGLISQFEDQLSGEIHESFNTRLESLFNQIRTACSYPAAKPNCDRIKSILHPNLPAAVPLVGPVPALTR